MDEDRRKQVAVFRFGVISDFVTGARLEPGERERLLRDKSGRRWQIPFSSRSRIARSTILSWIRRYQASGGKLNSLYPESRSDRGVSRALEPETVQGIIRLRNQLPKVSVPTLIAEVKRRGIVDSATRLSPSTLYRILHHHGLMDKQSPQPIDRRRFEAELPNDIWQSDAMHGPQVRAGDKTRKTYLFGFLDDMSRLIPHAQFYLTERLDSFLDAFRIALLKRGLPRKIYVDNGPAFRAKHLEEICASLGIALVHSRPHQPQGRGKCERFFRTLRAQFLSTVTPASLDELNRKLDSWIHTVYHNRTHSATGESPLRRFAAHMECIRPAPKELEDYFRKRARRRVAKDRTVSLNGRLYEAPVPLIGKQVTLLFHDHDMATVEILFESRSHGLLRPVDLKVNCRVRRAKDSLALEPASRSTLSSGKLPFRAKDEEVTP
jgi:transposase InsO family protein